jgi:TIR domain
VFDRSAQEVRWLADLQQVTFQMKALSHAAGRAVTGAVEVLAGPLLVAQVPLSVQVRPAGQRQGRAEAVTSTARLFGSVFASYAHEDDHVVTMFAEAYRALGIDLLKDRASPHAGEDWPPARSRLIEDADVFQLFWSKAASRSSQVAEEWRQALSLQDRKGERFIRPVYWKLPWPRPPAELRHLHFAPFDLALLSGVAAR